MRFTLADRIVLLEPGARIVTEKSLSLAEEYLADHFPRFPVMPGVLMLEALTQASAWLIRASEGFAHSVVTLQQARNVKFRSFVAPGQVLTISATIVRQDHHETHVDARGSVAGNAAVSGRLVLHRCNLADSRTDGAVADRYLVDHLKMLFAILYQPRRAAESVASDRVEPLFRASA